MKTNMTKSRLSALLHNIGIIGVGALATIAAVPVHAASFPQNPLLTGGNAIPPNILLIMDDSGSMDRSWMWADKDTSRGTADSVVDRSYVNNSLYYNPSSVYRPWRTADQNLNVRLAEADFKSVSNDPTSPTANKINLINSSNEGLTYFYIPKVTSPGTTRSNYNKYRISASSSSTNYNGGAVQRLDQSQTLTSGSISSVSNGNSSACISVPVAEGDLTITVSGSARADLYAFNDQADCAAYSNVIASHNNKNNPKAVTLPADSDGLMWFRVYADGGSTGALTYIAVGEGWVDMTPSGNTAALQEAELKNFANWYQYHRTRNKMAKAGASEAFGRLGENYRVGFDTIWNRNAAGTTIDTAGSAPAYEIPVGTNGGLFSGANRTNFYSRLHASIGSDSTPLKGALQRAARYFSTDAPWNDSNGNPLTCRQNYAILTTDGYWNSDAGYTSVGNADGSGNRDAGGNAPQYPDTFSNTLADVAYKYWSTDLKTGASWPNNVLTSAADPASWQHMVTFGVSIGLQGTLNPNAPAPTPWTVNPNTGGESAKRIDDLWHAALNGRGSFVVASNSDKFADALIGALSTIDSRSASGSNIASSSTKTDTSTLTFVAGYTSSSWLGDMIASPFNAALTGVSDTPIWILSKTFPNVPDTGNVYADVNSNFASRTVLTMHRGVKKVFRKTMANVDDFQARTGQPDEVTGADNVDYLLGIQTKEIGQTGGTLRRRAHPIGDIVDSSPAYVEEGSSKMVYIGANDGMLHGINATTGKVMFSYVPKGIDFTAMANLSATAYDHRYFVDGQIDVISRANQGSNKNILVAALGRGGRGVFALDVTNPGSMGTGQVLWDNTTQDATTDLNMGYVLGAVRIRKGNGGKTYAFVPNGIDSPNNSATLFVYELDSAGGVVGAPTELVAATGSAASPNGLMSMGMADLNADGLVDVVYGGDLKGNIYRWDFGAAALPTTAVKLFQATDASGSPQPITGGIGVGRSDTGTVFLGFGTGRFISSNDVPGVAVQQQQSMYGIKDEGVLISSRNDLQVRTIPFTGKTASGEDARGFEAYSTLGNDKKGWYIDLVVPERVISAPTIYGSAMILSTVIPATGNDCEGATGSGFLNAINLYTGTSPGPGAESYFTNGSTVRDANGNNGVLGSVGSSRGMPTEANVTSSLATVGTGAFTTEGGGQGNTSGSGIKPPGGGGASRVSWRELVPQQ